MNKTQCPHCFTVYVISDEQYRASQGMVRCGTCRERFQADIMGSGNTPRFDPRRVFIEPLSEHEDKPKITADDLVSDSPEIALKDPDPAEHVDEGETEEPSQTESAVSIAAPEPTQEPSKNEFSVDIEFKTDHVSNEVIPDANKAQADQASEGKESEKEPEEEAKTSQPEEKAAAKARSQQQELELPLSAESGNRRTQSRSPDVTQSEEKLIDKVDALIDDKLVGATANASKPPAPERPNPAQPQKIPAQPFDLNPKSPFSFARFFKVLLLIVIILSLGGALVYQLWLKQMIHWPDDPAIQTQLSSISVPLKTQLNKADIHIPTRRNLSKLELLSARTEGHPSRPSTTLLKVSLVNRAEISQPLPWLELALTDGEGRLVSRRSLSPEDYVFNNRVDGQIGPRELKKITIELLAFPKQATGYELKLLNK